MKGVVPLIYLDNASTTRMDPKVFDAMIPYLCDKCGNPNSPHALGKEAKAAVERAREQVAALINADPEQIVFTHSATDANRMAFDRFSYGFPVVSAVEHSSVLEAAKAQEGDCYRILPDKGGIVSPERMRGSLGVFFKDTPQVDHMASFMLVNNETGAVNDVKALAKEAGAYWLWFHTDATAAAGAMRIDAKDLGVDFMTFSAHKMHGPKGAAALYCRDPKCALAFANDGGTPDVPAIVGFGEACRIQKEWIEQMGVWDADYGSMTEIFECNLWGSLEKDGKGYVRNCPDGGTHFGRILSLRFDGVDAEMLVQLCSDRGLMISAGAACKSHEQKPSHVLTAMGLTDDEARSSVRISFSRMTTADECAESARILAGCVNDLRSVANER